MWKNIKDFIVIVLLFVSALGISCLVLQNFGIIPSVQKVHVVNTVDADVRGAVEIDGKVNVAEPVETYIVGGNVGVW